MKDNNDKDNAGTGNHRNGAMVRLRAGGPLMSVKEVGGPNARCTWFNDQGVPCEHVFAVEQLYTPNYDGKLAQLKSGGPFMAVEEEDREKVKCVWFDKNGVLCERTFATSAVRIGLPEFVYW